MPTLTPHRHTHPVRCCNDRVTPSREIWRLQRGSRRRVAQRGMYVGLLVRRRRSARGRAHDAADVVVVEELNRRDGTGGNAHERVRGILVAMEGAEQLLHL